MNLIELLISSLVCAFLVWLGRLLLGAHGWLLGAAPLGFVLLLLLVAQVRDLIRQAREAHRKMRA